MTIGAKLKKARVQHNLTQKHIADYLGVDQHFVSKIENDRETPTANVLDKLASLYGIHIADFLSDKDIHRKTICAVKATDLTAEDLRVISVINKIALNADFMSAVALNL